MTPLRSSAARRNPCSTSVQWQASHLQSRLLVEPLLLGDVESCMVGVGCPVQSYTDLDAQACRKVGSGTVGAIGPFRHVQHVIRYVILYVP